MVCVRCPNVCNLIAVFTIKREMERGGGEDGREK